MFFSFAGLDHVPGLEGAAIVEGIGGQGADHAADLTAAAGVEVAAEATAETEGIAADLGQSHVQEVQPDLRAQLKMMFSRMETERCREFLMPVATVTVVC